MRQNKGNKYPSDDNKYDTTTWIEMCQSHEQLNMIPQSFYGKPTRRER